MRVGETKGKQLDNDQSTGRVDMLGTMGNGGDREDTEGGEELDSSGELKWDETRRSPPGRPANVCQWSNDHPTLCTDYL